MTPRASHIVRAVAALAAGTLIMLPDTGRIAERPDPTSVYAAEDASKQVRDDLEEESYEDDDDDAEPVLEGAATLSPSQIKRVTLTPSASRSVSARRAAGYQINCLGPVDVEGLVVGFRRLDDTTCQINVVYQTLLSFEGALAELRSLHAPHKLDVTTAILSWSEKRKVTANMRGGSCVAFLSKPTEDWVGLNRPGRMPNDHVYGDGTQRKSQWGVLTMVQEWLNDPVAGRRGVVVRGFDESLDRSGDSVCYSTITNPRIKMVYTTPLSPSSQPVPKPARPTKPDLAVTRVSGPKEVVDGVTAVYEIAIWNDGTPAKGTAQVTINAADALEPVELVETPGGFTCDDHPLGGFSCKGSLGGVDDAVQERGAVFKLQVRGNRSGSASAAGKAGSASVYGLANHDGALDEMTQDNNMKLLPVTVK